jgi:hypothetical protein
MSLAGLDESHRDDPNVESACVIEKMPAMVYTSFASAVAKKKKTWEILRGKFNKQHSGIEVRDAPKLPRLVGW